MTKLMELLEFDNEADYITVRFRNRPTDDTNRLLMETAICIEEGRIQTWPNGYKTRLDRRPANQGGDQLHIEAPSGARWTYRYDGSRSERSKYTLPAINKVRDIVGTVFGISRDQIEECLISHGEGESLIVEITFR